MQLLFENWRKYIIKEEGALIEGSGLHWSRYELEYDDITLEPRDTRQGKGKYIGEKMAFKVKLDMQDTDVSAKGFF